MTTKTNEGKLVSGKSIRKVQPAAETPDSLPIEEVRRVVKAVCAKDRKKRICELEQYIDDRGLEFRRKVGEVMERREWLLREMRRRDRERFKELPIPESE